MEPLFLVAVLALGFWIHRLSARLEVLEKKVAALPAKRATKKKADVLAESTDMGQGSVPEQVRTVHTMMPEEPSELHILGTFFAWCAHDWLMKLGGLLVVLGAGWFVTYAFANNWVGPMGRIGLGLTVGALVLALGRYRIRGSRSQGSIVMVVGAAAMVLTLYAAREVYGFFSPFSVLVLMFLIAALLGYSAVAFKHRALAYANAALAGLAPLLVASADPSVPGLMTYLLVLTLGAVWLVALTGWREVVVIALAVVGLYSVGVVGSAGAAELDTGLLFAYLFTGVFLLVTALGMCRLRTRSLADLAAAFLTGALLYLWIMEAAAEDWQSMLFIGWALVFAVAAELVYRVSGVREHFYVYGTVSAVYLATATALLLDGPALLVAFALESAVLTLLAFGITKKADLVPLTALTFVVPMWLSLESLSSRLWRESVLHADAAALMVLMATLVLVALFFIETLRRDTKIHGAVAPIQAVVRAAWGLFGFYAIAFVWLSVHALLAPDVGTMTALIVYALAGSAFYMHGKHTGLRWERVLAGLLVGGVVARLLVVDIWNMALSGRITTFLVIGALLMLVAWLERSAITSRSSPRLSQNSSTTT